MDVIDMWYNKYIGFPFKHLGNDIYTGIDCTNLIKYVYKQELNIDIPYSSNDYCENVNDDWDNQIGANNNLLKVFNNPELGWIPINNLKPFDVIIISLGSTNVTNHSSLYVGDNNMLHITSNRLSNITLYGNYYKNYTLGKFRWKKNTINY